MYSLSSALLQYEKEKIHARYISKPGIGFQFLLPIVGYIATQNTKMEADQSRALIHVWTSYMRPYISSHTFVPSALS